MTNDPCRLLHQLSAGLSLAISWAGLNCSIVRFSEPVCVSFGEPKEEHKILLFFSFSIFVCMMGVSHTYI